jgi:hypothetical protein
MNIQRSPGPLSLLGILGIVIFGLFAVLCTLQQQAIGVAFFAFMVAACWLWARQGEAA